MTDSNRRPLACKANALTSWANPAYGAPSQIRTDDLRITSALLWPTELSGHTNQFYYAKKLEKKRLKLNPFGLSFGPKKWHLSVYIAASQRLRNWQLQQLVGWLITYLTFRIKSMLKGYGCWRKRQDSNLHAVADERFSRPRQYQLCLLFHMRVIFFMRIPSHWVTRFLPRAGRTILSNS